MAGRKGGTQYLDTGRGWGRGEEGEGARAADGAEEILVDAGEVHAAAPDQEQGRKTSGEAPDSKSSPSP
ncbi:unnamed protein product [Triticum turgidum subsp. durum]|uniref:Uncharacterized protein n=1 Tax=Triticum turgidum subsp. durum TaxID=4567 RepID=A0A9R0U4Z9_TRITD|nr:unnamed protein product [Triticum turgidum subsp. durum]